MDFESYYQDEIGRQVDDAFDQTEFFDKETRMAIVSFDLLDLIEKERVANDALFVSWTESGVAYPHTLHRIGAAILSGLNIGPTFAIDANHGDMIAPKSAMRDFTEKEKALTEARTQLRDTKRLMAEIYDLTPRQVRISEAQARKLKDQNQQ